MELYSPYVVVRVSVRRGAEELLTHSSRTSVVRGFESYHGDAPFSSRQPRTRWSETLSKIARNDLGVPLALITINIFDITAL